MRLKTYLLSGAKLSTIPQRNEASIGYDLQETVVLQYGYICKGN